MKNKTNLLIDFGMLAAFLVANEPRMTGENIHEWLSIGVWLVMVVHLLLHWDWIINVAKSYFVKLWHSSRLNFFVDVLLFLGFNAIMFSGLMISKSVLPSLGISVAHSGSWKQIHSVSAELTVWMVAAHFGLHWRWIVSMLKKYVVDPLAHPFQKKTLATVAVRNDEGILEK
jgi:hypothetical protein